MIGRAAVVAGAAAGAYWTRTYARYRRRSTRATNHEYELLRTASWEAYTRHYNERVPTMEEELDLWGDFHRHRHEMRYDIVGAAARRHLPPGGAVLDVGCGSALVADRLLDMDATYVGLDFPAHHIGYAARRFDDAGGRSLRLEWVRGDGEAMPFTPESFDVVVMSEVIEHLLRPERAVWEIARVLRPGGAFVMTTNNASEMPLVSPWIDPLAWAEKALGWRWAGLVSRRPWVWPEPVDPALLPEGAPPVYVPHTHHLHAETKRLFAMAGLDTVEASSFEFPPPQSGIARRLDAMGERGRRRVDVIEAIAQRTPLLNRLGTHLFMVAVKRRPPATPEPTPGAWPGPFSP